MTRRPRSSAPCRAARDGLVNGSEHTIRTEVTGLRFRRTEPVEGLPDGAVRYEMVSGNLSVSFEKTFTFGCSAASAGPVQGVLEKEFLDVLRDPDDSASIRYRAAGSMEPVSLDVSMNCGVGGIANFVITTPGDAWLRTAEDFKESPWLESGNPELLQGSYSAQMDVDQIAATGTWSWHFESVRETAED